MKFIPRLRGAALAALAALLSSCSTLRHEPDTPAGAPGFLAITNFGAFQKAPGGEPDEAVWLSEQLAAPAPWDELVMSWNAVAPPGTGIRFEARAIYPDRATAFYTLGRWAEDTAARPRESVPGQKDADGEVKTDTLVLKQPASRLQLRVTLLGGNGAAPPRLKFIGLSFLNTKASPPNRAPELSAWGKSLAVPERSQLAYRGGRDWCSPTSVSMVLGYWATRLKRPELNIEVPEVAAGVFDRNWPGTGNWPFNTALAGRFDGLRAWVARLTDVRDIESLVAAGIPVIVSVSYDALYNRTPDQGNGHLVVCVGFTESGDAVIHDPWADFSKGDQVRQIIPRQRLAAAWANSRRTAYVICPENWEMPPRLTNTRRAGQPISWSPKSGGGSVTKVSASSRRRLQFA